MLNLMKERETENSEEMSKQEAIRTH